MKSPRVCAVLLSSLALLAAPLAQAEGPRAPRKPVFTGEHVTEQEASEPPREVRHVAPKYPVRMLRAGIGGWVNLAFVIEVDGRTAEVQVVDSSHAGFESSAVDAARQWEFTPGKRDGRLVRVVATRRVEFKLEE